MNRIEGHVRVELERDGEIVDSRENHNTLTPYIEGMMNEGNFHMAISNSKLMSVLQNLSGLVMTENAEDPLECEVAHDNPITAQADNSSYTGMYLKRGTYISADSGVINSGKGYRHVWSFDNSYGNGTISSVCLCRPSMGRFDFVENAAPINNNPIDELLGEISSPSSTLSTLTVLDYENERGYKVSYDSVNTKILVDEYEVSTKSYHLNGDVGNVVRKIGATHEISQTVNNYNLSVTTNCSSVTFHGGKLKLITFARNSATMDIYAINPSDWSCSHTSIVSTGIAFKDVYFQNISSIYDLPRDIFPIITDEGDNKDYLFAYVIDTITSEEKIAKIDIATPTNVTTYNNPITLLSINTTYVNGPSLIYKNGGDFLKVSGGRGGGGTDYGVLYHAGKFYAVKLLSREYGALLQLVDSGYGTLIEMRTSMILVKTMFLTMATVYSLGTPVNKNAGLTMKVVYDVTES